MLIKKGYEEGVMSMKQNKITRGPLLDEKGRLIEKGFATSLVKQYDRKAIKAGPLRIKEWDYYLIHNHEYGVALTVADNDYMGLVSVTFFDFKNRTQHTVSPMIIMPLGRLKMPSSSAAGDVVYKNNNVSISFRHNGASRKLEMEMKNFMKDEPIALEFDLLDEPQDSMVIATPFKENPKAFYYNQKIIGMRARGTVKFKGVTHAFLPENSFGLLDWGRGVWTYNNTWYWSAAQGLIEDKVFGFNLGYGFGDNSAATENMLFYNGIVHKLEAVTFEIPIKVDGSEDYLKPWNFTSSDGRFEAGFTPILDRAAFTSLGIILSDQHQVFGYFDGKAILDNGYEILLNHFFGFAEKVRNKW